MDYHKQLNKPNRFLISRTLLRKRDKYIHFPRILIVLNWLSNAIVLIGGETLLKEVFLSRKFDVFTISITSRENIPRGNYQPIALRQKQPIFFESLRSVQWLDAIDIWFLWSFENDFKTYYGIIRFPRTSKKGNWPLCELKPQNFPMNWWVPLHNCN